MARKKPAAGSSAGSAAVLRGKTFCTAGKLHGQSPVQRLVAWRGGRMSKQVEAGLDYLILGQTGFAGAKKQADKLNQQGKATIQFIDESNFVSLASPTRDEVRIWVRVGCGPCGRSGFRSCR